MKFSRTFTAAASLSMLLLAGCGGNLPTHKDSADFVTAPIQDAEVMPVINEERNIVKVVVMDAANGTEAMARDAQVGVRLSKAVSQLLSGRNIEVVDDHVAPALADALRKAEMASNGSGAAYGGPKVANYAIKPVISSTNYGASYTAPSSWTDKKGRYQSSPGGYNHSASVKGTIRVYEMPSLRLVASVNVSGGDSSSLSPNGPNHGTGVAMLQAAADSAANNGRPELLNLFASKGYVVERRFNPARKSSVFQVSMGKADGLKEGDKVDIFNVRPSTNTMLKSAPKTEEIFVASGRVSGMLLTDATAWVALDDEETALRVRRGNLVKQKHTKPGFFGQ